MSLKALHQPVMLAETTQFLAIKPGRWYVEATFGRGGHTRAMLDQGAKVVAFDFDAEAVKFGKSMFQREIKAGQLILVQNNFIKLKETIVNLKQKRIVDQVWGILFDFGTSVDQLKSAKRGFSFEVDAPLDMRMNQDLGVTAADLLQVLSQKQLAEVFWRYGGERQARKIAAAIKKADSPLTTTAELAKLVSQVKGGRKGRLHPATKVFQALRIVVNNELENIEQALPTALDLLAATGRLVAISFHQGEDQLVKQAFKTWQAQAKGQILTKKPITPTTEEVSINPKARSAKLRTFRKA